MGDINQNEIKIPDLTNHTNSGLLDFMVETIITNINQETLAFKGGYMLNQLIPDVSRMTRDIDFSIASGEEYEFVKAVLSSMGDYLVSIGVVSRYVVKDTITPTSSGGIDFYDENNVKILGVDVGWHQLTTGTKWYDLNIGDIHAFSVERMLSDKIHAIFSPKRFRRTKDLYDVYYLLQYFDVDYDEFKKCLDSRGELDLQKNPFREDVLVQYEHAWQKLKIVSCNSDDIIIKPEFNKVISRLGTFCNPIMNGKHVNAWRKDDKRWK